MCIYVGLLARPMEIVSTSMNMVRQIWVYHVQVLTLHSMVVLENIVGKEENA